MTDLKVTDSLFFDKTGLDKGMVNRIVSNALQGCDDGELFMEYCQSESFMFDDGKVKSASFDTSQGFGLRA
ncbi:MAG: metalloprotease TldD, partial [Candidatus Marinimicrobia bacterium]|nr:metalloprotease TldD [Candidatus Neomarinimicrobiota bacterium]